MPATRVLPIAAVLALLAPAAAHGATLTADRQCYVQAVTKTGPVPQTLTLTGMGWAPGSGYSVAIGDQTASGTADDAGNWTSGGPAPTTAHTGYQPEEFTLTGQQDGADVATVTFSVVNFLVRPRDPSGSPIRKTTWTFSGFTPDKAIYFHLKRGSHVYTQKAGRGDAVCGTLKTRLRRLPAVPTGKIRDGTYKVFVDNRRRLRTGGLQYTASITIG